MKKFLMVCMGNICRSPMAQVVSQQLAADAQLAKRLKFYSAGTHAHHLGERPDPRALTTLEHHGYAVGRMSSRRITRKDFQNFDLILAMDTRNLTELRRLCPTEHLHKLRLFLDFAEGLSDTEIPDPYYGNAEGFVRVLALCEAAARGLLQHLAEGRTISHSEPTRCNNLGTMRQSS